MPDIDFYNPEQRAQIIIGHVAFNQARIWVAGNKSLCNVSVLITGQDDEPLSKENIRLTRDKDFTAVIAFDQPSWLLANSHYKISAIFRNWCDAEVQAIETEFWTPPEDDQFHFCFLLGSCNLSIVTLNHIFSQAVALAGFGLSFYSLNGKPEVPNKSCGFIDLLLRMNIWCVLKYFFTKGSRLKQQNLLVLRSPFQRIGRLLRTFNNSPESPFTKTGGPASDRPAFMMHIGDQIYYDVALIKRRNTLVDYHIAYREAWYQDQHLRNFLARCPQYMILDDHEIIDNYNGDRQQLQLKANGVKAYKNYAHVRHPQGSASITESGSDNLHYHFECGAARYFVINSRTEREPELGKMINEEQLKCLRDWLIKSKNPQDEKNGQVNFIVSSVPFILPQKYECKNGSDSSPQEQDDKWYGLDYRRQRDEILSYICDNDISNIVFLVGDMHISYHATMQIDASLKRHVIHELAAGPIYQIQLSNRERFCAKYIAYLDDQRKYKYEVNLHQIDSSANSVMKIDVVPDKEKITVQWKAFRTIPAPSEPDGGDEMLKIKKDKSTLAGEIHFD